MTLAGTDDGTPPPEDTPWGPPGETSIVSEPHLLALARRVRLLGSILEAVLWLVVAGSVLAFGAVHPWAYEALWLLCALAGLVTLARAGAILRAREQLGPQVVGLHSAGRWLVKNPPRENAPLTWRCDLGASVLPRSPLVLPALAFLAFVAVQLVPWPPAGEPWTLSGEATRRGFVFVAALLALHLAAVAAFTRPGARRRFRRVVAWLGLGLGFVALGQLAVNAKAIYGFFRPWESDSFYGPFVNRNNFAGYMLLVIPVGLGLLAEAWRRYRRRVGETPNLRRRLVAMGTREGSRLLYAALLPLVAIAALLASTSRGGILAFAASLALAAIGLRSRKGTPAWAAALVFVAVALAWFGLERLEVRFVRVTDDAPGRTVVWQESLALMDGPRWVTGYGFNAYAEALSRVPGWRLPAGATPWPEAIREALETEERYAYRAPGDLPGLAWYREAHNDWLQLLVETGLPGLALGLWVALGALLAARGDPWLFAALAGPLIHVFVDFDFQIPAIPVLWVILAALAAGSSRHRHSPGLP
jgi:O-antigen ligase